jgi:hypothetical protein
LDYLRGFISEMIFHTVAFGNIGYQPHTFCQ